MQTPDTGVHLIATCLGANMARTTGQGDSVVVSTWNMGSPTFVKSTATVNVHT